MRLVKISEYQYINIDTITDVYIGEECTIIRFTAPDFNETFDNLPTQAHRIELKGEAEGHFRRWLEMNSEDATKRRRQVERAGLQHEPVEEV